MTLIEFLLARIEEDEALAKVADPGPWKSSVEGRDHFGGDSVIFSQAKDDLYVAVRLVEQEDRVYNHNWVANQDHIARWDPARILVECKTKRCLLTIANERVMIWLALPYADHPAYDPAWSPTDSLNG